MRNHHIIAFLFALFIHAGLFLLIFYFNHSYEITQINISRSNKSQVSLSNFSLAKSRVAHNPHLNPVKKNSTTESGKSSNDNDAESKLDSNTPPTSNAINLNTLTFSHFTPPLYPRFAREKGLEGSVLISANYNQDGNIIDVKIVKSSGIKIFEESVLSASKNWKIKTSVSGSFQKNFEFKLNN